MPQSFVPTQSYNDLQEAAKRAAKTTRKKKLVSKLNKSTPIKRSKTPRRINTKSLAQKLSAEKRWLHEPVVRKKMKTKVSKKSKPMYSKSLLSHPLPSPTFSLHQAPVGGSAEGVSLIPVVSSNVAAYGYNDQKQNLYVQFFDGSIYKYDDVPEDIWTLFQTASSKGKFVWTDIRDVYSYTKIQ